MEQENAELVERSREALPGLAKARWPVFYLSGVNHKEHPLGCSSYCETNAGRVGCGK